MKLLCILVFISMVNACVLPAVHVQEAIEIIGNVQENDSGEPIADALIIFEMSSRYGVSLSDDYLGHAYSESDGKFSVQSIEIRKIIAIDSEVFHSVSVFHPEYNQVGYGFKPSHRMNINVKIERTDKLIAWNCSNLSEQSCKVLNAYMEKYRSEMSHRKPQSFYLFGN